MAGQWPQQPPQATYGYSNYPQQHPPQQYSPVQYPYTQGPQQGPYQQYNYAQAGQYQPPFQQPYQHHYGYQPVQPYQQSVAQPTLQSCYNCGSPEHWAQDCPEPRREVPAGESNHSSAQKPFKKFRPNYVPPVITKYAVPSNVPGNPGSASGYGVPPYEQPGIPRYQFPNAQPTPISAQSAQYPAYFQYQQWQEAQMQQQSHQIMQYPNNGHPRQSVVGHSPPASYPFGPPYPSPVSAQGPPQTPGYYPSYGQASYPQNAEHAVAHNDSRPSVAEVPFPTNQYHAETVNESARQRSLSQSQSMKSMTMTPRPKSAQQREDESNEDDLALLDVPDMPMDATRYGGRNTKMVQYPLPASVEDLEMVGVSLLSPAPDSDGCIKSAYISKGNFESFLEPQLHAHEHGFGKDDPVIIDTYKGNDWVPISLLYESRGRKTCDELKVSLMNESDEEGYDLTNRPLSVHSEDYIHDKEASPQFTSETKNHEWLRYSEQHLQTTTTRNAVSAQETEDRLAALGVTGAPKPVRAPARPYPPPETSKAINVIRKDVRRYSDKLGPKTRSRSRSPSRHEPSEYLQSERLMTPPLNGRRTPIFDQAYSSTHDQAPAPAPAHDHRDTRAVSTRKRDPFDPNDDDPDELLYHNQPSIDARYDQLNPPPPPHVQPPVNHSFSNPNLTRDGHNSPGSHSKRHDSYHVYSPDRINGYHQPESPIKLKSQRSYDRKRDREQRDDSDEDESKERKRQHDDVTPKLKRRQPKVAEAYR
ncbi:hypothetical protein MMC13_006331 [Lambiella insularis]|nr:hypothetical protein [Lambiella insularis]